MSSPSEQDLVEEISTIIRSQVREHLTISLTETGEPGRLVAVLSWCGEPFSSDYISVFGLVDSSRELY